MKYRLIHLSGSLAGRVRDVDASEIILGRDPSAAHVVFGGEDRVVARRHAALHVRKGVLVIRDLESSTGTFVDGQDVEEAELGHGDVFELGRGGPQVRVDLGETGTMAVPLPVASPSPPEVPRPSAPPRAPGAKLRLLFVSGRRQGESHDMTGSVLRLGRARGCAVWTPDDAMVSAQHAKVVKLEEAYVLIDLESTNGTYLHGHRIQRSALQEGDVIGLGPGGPQLRVQIRPADRISSSSAGTVVIPNFAELAGRGARGATLRDVLIDGRSLTIGRDPSSGLPLESPIVSRYHARITVEDDGLSVQDLDSTNGTYVGGRPIERAALKSGDRVVIGPFELVVGTLVPGAAPSLKLLDTRNRARLDGRDLSVRVEGKTILEGVSLSLPPGSFTALIGPSGAGKTTLLKALSGAQPATTGQVLLNGTDLYRSFALLKANLGYVPQEDIVHHELTVERSLDYTARLRLPVDTKPGEREKRLAEVLSTLELTERRDTPVGQLSGGQRKRVSIAVELLTEPSLLFLDEPTSGLDPGLEEALMLVLRELSYKGRTVVIVTHTLENIHLCDAVCLLVDGRLAFHGSPAAARAYFDIDHMVNLYARLKEKEAAQWRTEWTAASPPVAEPAAPETAAAPLPPRRGRASQLGLLATRYFEVLTRDGRNALLLVAQAPLIAGLIGLSLLYGTGDVAYTKPKNTILFLLALAAVWFGCSNAARELVKERAIYLRERMVNLRIVPYVLSKVLVLLGLATIQCVLFLLILDRWFGIPGRFGLLLGGMVLTSLAGILVGLTVSALSGSADRAMTLLPILLIPQVLFTSPAVQMDMKGPAGIVARAMPTWWAFDLLRRVALEPDDALDDETLAARLETGTPVLMTKKRFEAMLHEGYMLFQHRGAIEITWVASLPDRLGERLPKQLGRWRPAAVDALVLGGFAALLLAATVFLQGRYDRRKGR